MPIALCLGILLMLNPGPAFAPAAQSGGSTVEGRVTNSARQSIPNAHVSLQTDTYAERQMVYTDGSGRYRFTGLPPGTFYIVVESMDGSYEKEARRVEVNPVNERRDSSGSALGESIILKISRSNPEK